MILYIVTNKISAINEKSEEAQRSQMEIHLFKYDFHNDPDNNDRQNVLCATSPKRGFRWVVADGNGDLEREDSDLALLMDIAQPYYRDEIKKPKHVVDLDDDEILCSTS